MTNRRQILEGAAAALFVAGLSRGAFAAPRPLRVGIIGSGWFGRCDGFALMQVAPVEVVALCDVDRLMLASLSQAIMALPDAVHRQTRAPQLYHDYRIMLAKHAFDVVIVATPDHWHTLPAIAAMKAGAHVYLEKPVSLDVAEGKALVAAARNYNRVVQAGTQRRSSPPHIEARDRIVREGKLGTVGLVEIYGYYHQRLAQFPPVTTPPKTLDWDFYCGPAPLVPYRPDIHPLNWRNFRAFGNGYIADLGVHFIDTVRWMLGLGWPNTISSTGGVFVQKDSAATVPDTQTADFQYDNLLMTWSNREWGPIPDGLGGAWGAKLYGDKGKLTLAPNGYVFEPVGGDAHQSVIAANGPDSLPNDRNLLPSDRELVPLTRYAMRDFVSAIRTGKRPPADIEEGYISTSTAILANLAMDLGRPIRWDAKNESPAGDAEAAKRLVRPYRGPWIHPAA